MKFAILGVLIVLSIAFVVMLWKASQNWRWYQLVAALFTFAMAITFLFPTAGVLKSRQAWHQVKEKLEKQVEEVEKENQYVKYGDPGADNGVTHLSLKLAKLGRETGRRWRDLRMQGNNPQSITLVASAPQPVAPVGVPGGDEPAAGPEPIQLPPAKSVVYGFAEGNVNNQALPVFYLGEFKVTASGNNQVTIAPTVPLEPFQAQRIQNGVRTWSLYELLPLDGHSPFIAEGSVDSAENIFGRVDDQLVKSLLQNKVPAEVLNAYLNDGNRSSEATGRWVKIEFTANHQIDVDSPTQQGALESGFFDVSGRSFDSRLQRGGDGRVNFKKEDQIIVKDEAAKQLIDVDNVARLVDTYFVRPLNDYRYILRTLRLRLSEAAVRKTELEYEKQVLQDAIDATKLMLTSNQTDKLKLEQDLAQVEKERKAVTQYRDAVQADLKQNRQRSMSLYQDNIRLEAEIKRLYGN